MKIDSSVIGMESARGYQSTKVSVRRFTVKDYQGALANSGNTLNTAVRDNSSGAADKDDAADTAVEDKASLVTEWQNRFGITVSRNNIRSLQDNTAADIRLISLKYIFNLLFPSKRNIFDFLDETSVNTAGTTQVLSQTDAALTSNIRLVSYTQENYEWEQENTSFSTVGAVVTSDGRELSFNINIGMSREFEQYYKEELGIATFNLCDPLVINMDTDVAELSDQTFYFDIDADGEMDEISQLGSKSGYLALDRNGDGIINDGSELFGAESGDGFKDLAQYDDDGNGWIDENDEIWSRLQIWTMDEEGNSKLYRLADKGVGAICLQNTLTDFTLKGDDGQTKGTIRSTGIFLYENGGAGTIQHVDVAKYAMKA